MQRLTKTSFATSQSLMPRLNKQRRKELLRKFKHDELEAAHAALPIPNAEFQALFDMLDKQLPINGCDRSRRLTLSHIRLHSLPEDAVLQWLDDNCGFCDCTILRNTEQLWQTCKDFQPKS